MSKKAIDFAASLNRTYGGKTLKDISDPLVLKIVLKDEKDAFVTVSIKNGKLSASANEETDKPDAVISAKLKSIEAVLAGKSAVQTSVLTGKLKVSGNLQKAAEIKKLIEK